MRRGGCARRARAKRGQSTKNKMRPPRAPFSLTRAVVTSASRSRAVARRGMAGPRDTRGDRGNTGRDCGERIRNRAVFVRGRRSARGGLLLEVGGGRSLSSPPHLDKALRTESEDGKRVAPALSSRNAAAPFIDIPLRKEGQKSGTGASALQNLSGGRGDRPSSAPAAAGPKRSRSASLAAAAARGAGARRRRRQQRRQQRQRPLPCSRGFWPT